MDIHRFAKAMLEFAFDGSDVSGGDIQDLAQECGLIVETKYDPEKHGTAGLENCEPGDAWFVYSSEFKAAAKA